MLSPLSVSDMASLDSMRDKSGAASCGLATKDGKIVLQSAGDKAVVNLLGKPTLLRLQADHGAAGKTFGNQHVSVAIAFVADDSDANGTVIAHQAGVTTTLGTDWNHFYGLWTC